VLDAPERLDAGAPGKVLLAFAPDAARESYLRWIAETRGAMEAAALRATVAAIRDRGYVLGPAERAPEFNAVSVPVLGGALAALTVVGPGSRFSLEVAAGFLPAVQATAAAIGGAVGGR
jgi:DNA-binding IclR family transcriptional regulator